MPRFRDVSYVDVPVAYSLVYADAPARLAASGLTAADRGRIALQQDTGEFWILNTLTPVTWALVGLPPSTSSYVHTQSSPSATWTVNHNLGYYPSVQIRSTGGVVIGGRVVHTSVNQSVITFNTPLAGTARAN